MIGYKATIYIYLLNSAFALNITHVGRSDLESLMGSQHPSHWVQISEMLLGPVPAGFSFTPKHKSNAYSGSGTGNGGGGQENG